MPATLSSTNEPERLTALQSYHILDTATEPDFEDITELASAICGTPIALISLIDENRQWFKSHKGVDVTETDRMYSFCAHAIETPTEIMEVEDAHLDVRFKDNPLVTGEYNLTFYAGAPLVNEDGFALGSLCVIDSERKKLTDQQQKALKTLAKQVMDKLELKRKAAHLQAVTEEQRGINRELNLLNKQLQNSTTSVKESERALSLAINAARFGTWHIDRQTRALIASPRLKELFGFYPNEEVTLEGCIAQITDEYREEVTKAIEKAIVEGGDFNTTCTVRGYRDNVVRWLKAVGNLAVDTTGAFTAFTGVLMDITEQTAANNKIAKAQQQLEQALSSANLGTWSIDIKTNKVELSPRFKEVFGLPADKESSIQEVVNAIDENYRQLNYDAIENAIQNGTPADFEYTLQHAVTGKKIWARAFGKVFLDENNQPETFSGIIQDITEQKTDDQRKNDFINMVSHELKTPLTSMSGYIQLLNSRAKKAGDGFTAGIMDKTFNQVKKMTTLINGFLNMNRLESGKIHLDVAAFDIEALLQEVIEESSVVFSTHQIRFTTCTPTIIHADHNKIGQVITNFISNAVKYAFTSRNIDIACHAKDQQVTISVTDYGNGIQLEDQEKIFERYYRVENSKAGTIAGFGIGLYLCAEIISRHNGQIGVRSEVGEGSTFWFSLPLD